MGGKKGTQEQRERQGRKIDWLVGWRAGRLAGGHTSRVAADFGLRKRFLKPIHTLAYLNVVLSFSLTGPTRAKRKAGLGLGEGSAPHGRLWEEFFNWRKEHLKKRPSPKAVSPVPERGLKHTHKFLRRREGRAKKVPNFHPRQKCTKYAADIKEIVQPSQQPPQGSEEHSQTPDAVLKTGQGLKGRKAPAREKPLHRKYTLARVAPMRSACREGASPFMEVKYAAIRQHFSLFKACLLYLWGCSRPDLKAAKKPQPEMVQWWSGSCLPALSILTALKTNVSVWTLMAIYFILFDRIVLWPRLYYKHKTSLFGT